MAHFDSLDAIPDGKLRQKLAAALEEDTKRRRARVRTGRGNGNVTRTEAGSVPAREPTLEPLVLDLPLPPWSLNREREAPPYVRMEHVKAVKLAVLTLLPRDAGRYEVPVEVEATPRGVKHDAGNSIPTIKAAIDQIVTSGVLTDDRGAFVRRLILNAPIAGEKGLTIIVRPARETSEA